MLRSSGEVVLKIRGLRDHEGINVPGDAHFGFLEGSMVPGCAHEATIPRNAVRVIARGFVARCQSFWGGLRN